MTEDRIERAIEIRAPIDKVWAVLTEPEHVGRWFGTGSPVEIDLRPGGVMVLDHGEHGTYATVFVAIDPPRALSYRWAAGYPGQVATEENATLVEFTLEPAGDGTLLRVVETGFASLAVPAGREDSAGYESHADGWSAVVRRLGAYVEGDPAEPLAPPA